jgi:hypothetical protein
MGLGKAEVRVTIEVVPFLDRMLRGFRRELLVRKVLGLGFYRL